MTIIFPANQEEWYIRDDGIEVPAVFNEDGTVNEEESLKKLDAFKRSIYTYSLNISGTLGEPMGGQEEMLFVGQQQVRSSYSVNTQQATDIINQLHSAIPEIDVASFQHNWIGISENYRAPYNNAAISWYEYKSPTAELLEEYNIPTDIISDMLLLPWYGIKYIPDTGEKYLKLVQLEYNGSIPELPYGMRFFARIYTSDGILLPDVDCYTYTSAEMMQKYCNDNNLVFPAPAEHADSIDLWGVVFNSETLSISIVKAYKFVSA